MAQHSFTEVTTTSWFGRMGRSFKGILIGIILVGVSFPVLWINEGRAVRRAKDLKEGQGLVVPIEATDTQPELEGKLVHMAGRAETDETLRDPQFNVTAPALKLRRHVEMYQWEERESQETRKKLGGGEETVTTYSYHKTWSPRVIRSSQFKDPTGRENPARMEIESDEFRAGTVRLGAYELSASQVNRIDAYEPVRRESTALAAVPDALRARLHLTSDGFYLGADPATPQVGDLRISFSQVPPVDVSIVSRRIGRSFEPFKARYGSLDLLQVGLHSAEGMFAAAQQQNVFLTWVLRGVGFLLMMIGFRLIMEPLGVIADVIPFLGNILRMGTGIFSFVLAFSLSLVTVAIAWFAYRPLLGGSLLALAVASVVVVARRGKASQEAAAAPAPTAVPPPPPPPPSP